MIKAVMDFINYWYFRYLLVTELYMVEKWERNMFHIIAFTLLFVLALINNTIVVGFVSYFMQFVFQQGRRGNLENIANSIHNVQSDL